ncbi:Protein kinase domain [Dillenia turbinata]|uniref:Protein kinase domain n=1 Tax=Dillenia turbinata TaxID=194707 RepID=A0AAN8W679_9MAGN
MEWTRGPLIGRGSSATVFTATCPHSGRLFAVKSSELSLSSSLQREQTFLSQFSSPQLVNYIGFDVTKENDKTMYNLFIQYIPGGTLCDAILSCGGSLSEPMIRFCTREILLGLEYLHSNGVVHCDIKGRNILMARDGPKIADLGCARFSGDCATSTFSGTPMFMGPEVARGEEQGYAADIWALGCTVIEMAMGHGPWDDVDDPVLALYRIGFSDDVPEFPMWLAEEGKDFLSKCLRRDPRERWTAIQLLQHPFLNGLDTGSKRVDECGTKSPISVLLDLDFWDSSVVVSKENEMHFNDGKTLSSPADRIRILSTGCSGSSLDQPDWTGDENWIMVRCNGPEVNSSSGIQNDQSSYGSSLIEEEKERSPDNIVIVIVIQVA